MADRRTASVVNRSAPIWEPLEGRQLLTSLPMPVMGPRGGLVRFGDSVLTVEGTRRSDTIVLSRSIVRGTLRLSVGINGESVVSYKAGLVQQIRIVGGRGDDALLGGTIGNVGWLSTKPDFIPSMTLEGGFGNDVLEGCTGNDLLDGGEGDDSLQGEAGDDTLLGGDGNDSLIGSTGSDLLRGGAGDDQLDGNGDYRPPLPPGTAVDAAPAPGNGTWNDSIYGGAGVDTFFKFDKASEQLDVTAQDKLV
jgi:Ca2+-binding RTX toxin-like protein